MSEPVQIPSKVYENPATAATQLKLLLDAAASAVDEEFKRTERIEQKSRNQTTFTATLYAGAQALAFGLINGLLKHSSFIPYLAGVGAAATIVALLAFIASFQVWQLRDEFAVQLSDIGTAQYIESALVGNPRVGVNLVQHYVQIGEDRSAVNDERIKSLEKATVLCAATVTFVAGELVLAFVAAAVR